jgi:hypothetical protein
MLSRVWRCFLAVWHAITGKGVGRVRCGRSPRTGVVEARTSEDARCDRQTATNSASGFFAGEFTRNGRFQRHQRRREESHQGNSKGAGLSHPVRACDPPGLLGGGGPQHAIVAPTDCDFRDGSLMIARPSALPCSSLWGSCVRSCVQKVQSCCNQKVKTWESCRAIHHHHHHHLVWVCE